LVNELEALYREWSKPDQSAEWRRNRDVVFQKVLASNLGLLRENLNDPGLLKSYGSLLAQIGRDDEAEAAYQLVAGLQPNDPSAHENLADVLSRLGRNAEAEAAYRRAVELDPDSANYQRALGHFLCYTMGQPTKALLPLQEAVRLDPKNTHAHYDVGSAYAFTGQWDRAIAAYRRALDLDPNGDSVARYRLASLYLYVGDVDGYRTTCRDMVQRYGTSSDRNVMDRTAKICLLAFDADENRESALALADKNVLGTETHPDHRWFVLAKGLADYHAGRYAAALKRLEQLGPDPSGGHSDASAFAQIAMAQNRLHHSDKARAALASARQILLTTMPNPAEGRPFGDDWHDWLHSEVLVREAEGVIEKQASTRQRKTEIGEK
jgi:Flp pilus assembly protein TadD